MSDDKQKPRSAADDALEKEIRAERKFSLAEAIGRLAGPGAMKGASPVSRLQQAQMKIETWLKAHLGNAGGDLEFVLCRNVKESELLMKNPDQPLIVLAAICQRVLDSEYLLQELVRQADAEWGVSTGERPYFEIEGTPAHPRDPYTIESVRSTLTELVEQLAASVD
jgi:hypothetical protein